MVLYFKQFFGSFCIKKNRSIAHPKKGLFCNTLCKVVAAAFPSGFRCHFASKHLINGPLWIRGHPSTCLDIIKLPERYIRTSDWEGKKRNRSQNTKKGFLLLLNLNFKSLNSWTLMEVFKTIPFWQLSNICLALRINNGLAWTENLKYS